MRPAHSCTPHPRGLRPTSAYGGALHTKLLFDIVHGALGCIDLESALDAVGDGHDAVGIFMRERYSCSMWTSRAPASLAAAAGIDELGEMVGLHDVGACTQEQTIEPQNKAPIESSPAAHDTSRDSGLAEFLGKWSSHVDRAHGAPERR
jgi:hypothetical protein